MLENTVSVVTVDWKGVENKSGSSHWESDASVGLR